MRNLESNNTEGCGKANKNTSQLYSSKSFKISLLFLISVLCLCMFSCSHITVDHNPGGDPTSTPGNASVTSGTGHTLPPVTAIPAKTEPTSEPEITLDEIKFGVEEAYPVYKAAMDKNNSLDDIEQNQHINVFLRFYTLGESVSTEYSVTLNSQNKGRHGNNPVSHLDNLTVIKTGGSVSESEIELFIGEEKIFIKSNELQDYLVINRNDPKAEPFNSNMTEDQLLVFALEEDVFSTAMIKEKSDGSKIADFYVKEEKMREIFGDFFDQLEETYKNNGAERVTFNWKSMLLTYTISADGFIIHLDITAFFELSFYLNSTFLKGNGSINGSSDVSDPGTPVIITFPDGTTN